MVSPGVSACPGCGGELVLRRVLQLAGENTIVCVPPGCMAWQRRDRMDHNTGMKIPVHIPLLDNTASFMSGLSHIYERRGRGDVNIVAVAGDGATADCGFQSLSERQNVWEKMLYVCYDNEGYMNTGYQRSSANHGRLPHLYHACWQDALRQAAAAEISAAHNGHARYRILRHSNAVEHA